jgi:hypothetical protein
LFNAVISRSQMDTVGKGGESVHPKERWSGRRESNPPSQLGRLELYH